MAKEPTASGGDVFDVRKVRRLVELMHEYDLAEIDLRQSDQRICLKRGGEPEGASQPVYVSHPSTGPAPPAVAAGPPPAAETPEADAKYIRSPIVGTFYISPSPDAAPFVKVGDQVGPETTVCIVEAMKVFNEVPAECSGKILAVLAQNGDPVEFGQPLFKVE